MPRNFPRNLLRPNPLANPLPGPPSLRRHPCSGAWLLACCLLLPAIANFQAAAQSSSVPAITGNPKVDKLLSQMTLEEKLTVIRGSTEHSATNQGEAGYLAGIPRLGIPPLRLADGPPGVLTRLPSQAETSTMGLAATFSPADAEANGEVIAREAKTLGIGIALQPFINIDRDITFTRAYNTYGEDPVLTGAIGAGLVRGIQSQGVLAQAKHFVGYDTDGNRVFIDPQALHEIYLAPFADVIHAGVSSVMCSYNKINGASSCGNSETLKTILRKELNFQGFVTSDWGAVHSPAFINHGLDMEMPGTLPKSSPLNLLIFPFFTLDQPHHTPRVWLHLGQLRDLRPTSLPEEPKPARLRIDGIGSFFDKQINFWNMRKNGGFREETVTQAAGRVLNQMDKFGLLYDPNTGHTPSHQPQPRTPENLAANAAIIQKTAEDSAVLLKNENSILPLKPEDLSSIALIGPGAGQVVAIGTAGERSTGLPERQIGPLEALRRTYPAASITYAVADDMTGTPIPATLWTHSDKPGIKRTTKGHPHSEQTSRKQVQFDTILDFTRKSGSPLAPNSDITWTGSIDVPSDGDYWIYLQLLGAAGSVKIDGSRIAGTSGLRGAVHGDTVLPGKDGLMPTTDGLDNVRGAANLTAGQHSVTVHIQGDTSNNPEEVRLAWVTPEQRQANHQAAITAAKTAAESGKPAIVFAWSRGRPDFALPGVGEPNGSLDQNKLIEEVAAANPNTIVVLNTSQPVALPWLDKVRAVLQMWWPGDEGGWATANVLTGKVSPAGRLPFTWAKKLTDYPATDPAHRERSADGRHHKTTYSEGIYVGYRWFDNQQIDPIFPFGYGLSYTQFAYSGLTATLNPDNTLEASFTVTNTGQAASDEVPQLYLGAPEQPQSGNFAILALAAFDRIHLNPGESKTVTLLVPQRRLQFWDTKANQWSLPHGPRKVLAGRSARDLPLSTTITLP